MKRSKAIENLEQYMSLLCYASNYMMVDKEAATDILDFLEDMGMVPPEIKEFVEIPAHNALGAGFKIGHNAHKWEEED